MAAMMGMIAGLAFGAIGAVMQFQGQKKQQEAQERAIQAQQRAEAARQRQMQIESSRKRREIVRQNVIARSNATAAAVAGGAQFGSGLPGALGAISNQSGYNIQGVNAAETLGNEVFSARQQQLSANRDEARAGGQIALGSGISSLGGAVSRGLGSIGRLGG